MRALYVMETEQTSSGEALTGPGERAGEETAGLERIREILFGSAQRDLERRVVRSDSQASARLLELEQETRRRVELLEVHVKRETEALLARMQSEVSAIGDTMRKQAREQREALNELEGKLSRIEEVNVRGQRDLRQELLEQAKSFLDELQRMRKDVLASLQEELGLDEEDQPGAPHGTEGQRRH
jgi:hypothetical protein